ncbi:head GIN domain-containing protein [Flavobacterium sp.]|uniref:head GIN domain-containing protein n=1 Tax=Flavobacterium sp. TaxID=239 RepID=UPI0026352154|nr:head GIN domain-containing protein [Flavobacterium sp.]
MIKMIVQVTKLIITAITILLFGSCSFVQNSVTGIPGSGNVITQDRNINGGFTYVSSGSGLEVTVEQADTFSVIVEADDNLHNHITTEVKNNELSIRCDVNIRSAKRKKVMVKMPVIDGLSSSSGSSLKGTATVKSDNLNLSSSSGSSLDVSIQAANVICESSSGSHLTVKGAAKKAETSSSSGSSIDATELSAEYAKADASSGSSIRISVKESLDAEASSGGSVVYNGNPAHIDKQTSSGGSVSRN